jgi:hypothetical protein
MIFICFLIWLRKEGDSGKGKREGKGKKIDRNSKCVKLGVDSMGLR